jgi:hypothetical protein
MTVVRTGIVPRAAMPVVGLYRHKPTTAIPQCQVEWRLACGFFVLIFGSLPSLGLTIPSTGPLKPVFAAPNPPLETFFFLEKA